MANITKVQKLAAIAQVLKEQGIDSITVEVETKEGAVEETFGVNDFLEHEIEITNNKNRNRSTSPTKADKENEILKPQVVEFLERQGGAVTTSQVGQAVGVSTPKATAVLKLLVKEGKVVRNEDGKKPMFAIA